MNVSRNSVVIIALAAILVLSYQFAAGRRETPAPGRDGQPPAAATSPASVRPGVAVGSTQIAVKKISSAGVESSGRPAAEAPEGQVQTPPLTKEEIRLRSQEALAKLRSEEAKLEATRQAEAEARANRPPEPNPYEAVPEKIAAIIEAQKRARMNPDLNNPYERLVAEHAAAEGVDAAGNSSEAEDSERSTEE